MPGSNTRRAHPLIVTFCPLWGQMCPLPRVRISGFLRFHCPPSVPRLFRPGPGAIAGVGRRRSWHGQPASVVRSRALRAGDSGRYAHSSRSRHPAWPLPGRDAHPDTAPHTKGVPVCTPGPWAFGAPKPGVSPSPNAPAPPVCAWSSPVPVNAAAMCVMGFLLHVGRTIRVYQVL